MGSGYAIIDSGMGVGAYKISGGGSGGFVVNLVTFLLSALGGYADAYTKGAREGSSIVLNKTRASYSKAASTFSKFAGPLGLALSIGGAVLDDNLSLSQKIGQASSTVLGALISGYMANAIGVAFIGSGALVIGPLMAAFIAIALHIAITVLITTYFASIKVNKGNSRYV